jgi:hypothetical protein
LGVCVHTSLTGVRGIRAEERAAKPLTTQFVKRQPRLTKPLELKKRPQPKRRQVRREMVAVRARADRREVTSRIRPLAVMGSVAKPRVDVDRLALLGRSGSEPAVSAQAIQGARTPEHMVDLSLEMVDVDDLDTGQYHAMVIQDPNDKRNIEGFFHMYVAFSKMGSSKELPGLYYEWPSAFPNLMKFLNQHTSIRAKFAGRLFFSDDEIMKAPFLYTSVDANRTGAFQITGAEALNLHTYMQAGGLWCVEDAWCRYGGVSDRTARRMILDAFAAGGMSKGRDWEYQNIPKRHPVNHCFYDFDDGPPPGLDVLSYHDPERLCDPPYPIEMVVIDGRLWCIMSNRDYEDMWSEKGNAPAYHLDPTTSFMFGVNMIVFALTQEGGITHRLMAGVQY